MTTTIAADFSVLQGAITTHFDRMKAHPLFRVDVVTMTVSLWDQLTGRRGGPYEILSWELEFTHAF